MRISLIHILSSIAALSLGTAAYAVEPGSEALPFIRFECTGIGFVIFLELYPILNPAFSIYIRHPYCSTPAEPVMDVILFKCVPFCEKER